MAFGLCTKFHNILSGTALGLMADEKNIVSVAVHEVEVDNLPHGLAR